jgi:release factor glutamine methyltransferase
VLLAHVLGVGRPYLLAHGEDVLPASARAAFEALIARRTRGEPVAYLTGYRGWYDLVLRVTPAVLVPRPETEGLLERALAWARERGVTRIADIGTGTGALAIALARALPGATVYATDISEEALAVARENAAAVGAQASIVFLQGDLLAPLPERVDLIVANLPYLGEDEHAGLPRDVRCYEPRQALVGGPQGHEILARLLATAPDHLQEGGAIMAELGPPQALAAAAAARAAFPTARIRLERDYAELLRYLIVTADTPGGKGQVSITVEVDTTRDTVMGQGTQRHRARQVVALYRLWVTGTADAQGRLSRHVPIAYQPSKPMPASIAVTVRLPQGTATGRATATLLPRRHH